MEVKTILHYSSTFLSGTEINIHYTYSGTLSKGAGRDNLDNNLSATTQSGKDISTGLS